MITTFLKWLVLKAFISNEISNATKIAIIFILLYEISFLLAHLKREQFIAKYFDQKLQVSLVKRDYYIVNSIGKESKILYENGNSIKGNITTKYIKYSHKNTGTRGKSIPISGLQCFNSSIKCWKPVSLKPSFDLSVEIQSQFSRLVCFNWVHK